MRPTALDLYHPIVQMTYFVSAIAFVMLAFQPVYLGLGVACGLAYGCFLSGVAQTVRSISWQLPLIAIMCLVNPIFSASGSTLLVSVGPLRVYAEALAYGACFGLMLVAAMSWFSCASHVVSVDKVMGTLGNVAPVIALMVSMVSRLVPSFLRRGHTIDAVQRACSATTSGGGKAALIRDKARLSTVLVGWALEDSFETADSMRARGWGCGRRTTYQRTRFRARDGVALVFLALVIGLNAWLAWTACSGYAFYPKMTRLALWWGYLPYAAYLLLPLVLEGIVRVREELSR